MSVTLKSRLLAIIGISAAILSASLSAGAHTASNWYPAKWPSYDRTVNWRFANGFPSGSDWRARVKDGASQWNAVTGSSMSFQFDTPDYSAFSATTCAGSEQKNGVHWGTIDGGGGTLAQVILCTFFDVNGTPWSNSELHDFQMKFDSAESWYTGLFSPSGAKDAWSVSTHEFGHATGRGRTFGGTEPAADPQGHFTGSTLCPNSDAHHSMCQYIGGSNYDRDLNTHDVDTFQDAY